MSSALITQFVIGGLSTLGLLSTWILLHLPDPGSAWRTDLPGVPFDLPYLGQPPEELSISPTHDWRGLV